MCILCTGVHPVEQLTNIVLEGYEVSHVTSGAGLGDLCPQLQELHLARNSLSLWDEVGGGHTYLLSANFHPYMCDMVLSSVRLCLCVLLCVLSK